MPASLNARPRKTKRTDAASRLLAWWDIHRRALPWRAGPGETPDPYAVWLSEILLQQTTVAAATPYFLRFMTRWPRVTDLAAAPLDEVMQAFAGLGYYSRARNMHACAQEIARRGGAFPQDEADLRKLPGIGAYTGAAIAAIAFNRPAAPVDGNIARIIARLNALERPIAESRKQIAAAAAALTPPDRPGDFAQAMMDLGATICAPRRPNCRACPLTADCAAFAGGEPEAFPRKAAKPTRPLRRGVAFFLRAPDDRILMRTRPPKGLLGGTVELPGGEWSSAFNFGEALAHAPARAEWRLLPGLVGQVFTHFALELAVYAGRADSEAAPANCYWVKQSDLGGLALSGVMSKVVAHALRYESHPFSPQSGEKVAERSSAG
ncbi:MAG TPA: A/G-specific adenine glycosylase [Roseiarcus sp.]|nr:A/G-specific adenine glycosylase [Roseiarcus sp.]